jgi:hypothetical protein
LTENSRPHEIHSARHNTGHFGAYDADALKELWSFDLGTPITAPPMSYNVNGNNTWRPWPAASSEFAAPCSTSPPPS